MKTLKTVKEIDISKYVNIETGELMASELSNAASIKILKDTHLVEIQSEEYVILDSTSLSYLRDNKILSKTDLGYVTELSDTLKTGFNALHKSNNHIHTIDSISQYLDLSYEKARALVNRLIDKGVLYKLSGKRGGAPFKAFIMNPYIARKRKFVFHDCASLFEQFRDARDLHSSHNDVPKPKKDIN